MTGRLLDWTSVVSANNDNGDNENNQQEEEEVNAAAATSDQQGKSIPPYVAIIEEENYTDENIAKLVLYAEQYTAGEHYGQVEEGGPLRGVLVVPSSATTSDFTSGDIQFTSPESLTPQGDNTPSAQLTVGSSYEWNVNNAGDGLTTTDMYGIPTAYIVDVNTATYLKNVATEQSASLTKSSGEEEATTLDVDAAVYPSILSEFNYYMGPGGEVDGDGNDVYNSKKCLEWKDNDGEWYPRCAPLGGNSVWAVAGSPVATGYSENENNAENDGEENNDNGNQKKPIILVAASIDSTSMFHDLSPGANTAASNILTLLMAAQLIGSSIKDETLDQLYSQITFAFFQGEGYGYIGSRRFLKDVVDGFQCSAGGEEGVAAVYKRREENDTIRACLNPTRADLTFQNLGEVRGMISVDQVGNLGGSKNMYVQGGEATDGGSGFATFLSEAMIYLSGSDDGGYMAQASSVGDQDDGTSPLPPTPLSSLVSLSGGAQGGVALTGYDDAFVANSLYHSHLDSTSKFQTIDKDAIAAAATLVARSAVAAAYQNANNEVDYATAAAYALEQIPNTVDSSSDTFAKLYKCLFEDGNCDTFLNYGGVERANDAVRTGNDLGMGVPLGTPPNYYTSIYDSSNGQEFVYASGKYWGAMTGGDAKDKDGNDIKNYGEDETDAFLVRPSLLEMSLSGLLNDFLGRGSFVAQEDGSDPALATCKSSDDCSSVSYCNMDASSSVVPTCAGGSCVCGSRSHYHPALDEALSAAANSPTSRFEIQDDDEGASALYTEPYWSSYVGVRIYNDAGNNPGVYAASIGAVFALACLALVWRLKKTMVKQKVY